MSACSDMVLMASHALDEVVLSCMDMCTRLAFACTLLQFVGVAPALVNLRSATHCNNTTLCTLTEETHTALIAWLPCELSCGQLSQAYCCRWRDGQAHSCEQNQRQLAPLATGRSGNAHDVSPGRANTAGMLNRHPRSGTRALFATGMQCTSNQLDRQQKQAWHYHPPGASHTCIPAHFRDGLCAP
jgi:hypothetical protein